MIKQKILQYIDSEGISKANFYDKTGIKRGLLDADKLNMSISDVTITKILVTFTQLSPDWLLLDQGGMYRSSANISQHGQQNVANSNHVHIEDNRTYMADTDMQRLTDHLQQTSTTY